MKVGDDDRLKVDVFSSEKASDNEMELYEMAEDRRLNYQP